MNLAHETYAKWSAAMAPNQALTITRSTAFYDCTVSKTPGAEEGENESVIVCAAKPSPAGKKRRIDIYI